MKRLADNLVLVGAGNYGESIPYDSPDYEKWVLTSALKKLDENNLVNTRGFEIHTLETRSPQVLEFLKNSSLEIIMQDTFNDIKKPIKYPLHDIIKRLQTRYFTCSASYMLALAQYMGYKKVILRGMNMLMEGDIQKYSVEYWLGRLTQSGLEIELSEWTDLLKCPVLYGYEADNTLAVYQCRIINELTNQIALRQHNIINAVQEIQNMQSILRNENAALMKQIMDRHKIDAGKWEDEEEN